jgi:hypothetical protein
MIDIEISIYILSLLILGLSCFFYSAKEMIEKSGVSPFLPFIFFSIGFIGFIPFLISEIYIDKLFIDIFLFLGFLLMSIFLQKKRRKIKK